MGPKRKRVNTVGGSGYTGPPTQAGPSGQAVGLEDSEPVQKLTRRDKEKVTDEKRREGKLKYEVAGKERDEEDGKLPRLRRCCP